MPLKLFANLQDLRILMILFRSRREKLFPIVLQIVSLQVCCVATHKKHLSDGPDILNELGRLLTWKGHKSMLKTRRTEFEFISNRHSMPLKLALQDSILAGD